MESEALDSLQVSELHFKKAVTAGAIPAFVECLSGSKVLHQHSLYGFSRFDGSGWKSD